MSAALSSFNSVPFQIRILNDTYTIQQTPKVINRYEPTRVGTIKKSITGTPALQEIDRKWIPITLLFTINERPPSVMSDAIVKAFVNGMNTGGTQTLVVEGTTMSVFFDWSEGQPLQYEEVTATGEFDTLTGGTIDQRLYTGSVRFLKLLS